MISRRPKGPWFQGPFGTLVATPYYAGDKFPRWKNQPFVGVMRGEELQRLVLDNDKYVREEVIFEGLGRARDAGPFDPSGAGRVAEIIRALGNSGKALAASVFRTNVERARTGDSGRSPL